MKTSKKSKNKVIDKNNIEILKAVLDQYTIDECKKQVITEDVEFSDNCKREMNRIFREYIKSNKPPYPEVESK